MAIFEDPAFRARSVLNSEQETCVFAEEMSARLGAGDTVLLSGEIGAGKSHFARCLIRHLLAKQNKVEDIPSPTFTLVQTYVAGTLEIWHTDLYRLTNIDEIYELGLTEAWTQALCLVEWPDRLGREVPLSAVSLEFCLRRDPGKRLLKVGANDPKWIWLTDMVHEMAAKND